MTTGMVERVARAIANANDGDDFDRVDELVKLLYLHEARAAIAALREPTTKMICAALDSTDQAYSGWWRAMLDAALGEEKS